MKYNNQLYRYTQTITNIFQRYLEQMTLDQLVEVLNDRRNAIMSLFFIPAGGFAKFMKIVGYKHIRFRSIKYII